MSSKGQADKGLRLDEQDPRVAKYISDQEWTPAGESREPGVTGINEAAWITLPDYPKASIAQIARTTLSSGRRLVIRRVRTLDRQGQLLPTWEHFAFITNRPEPLAIVEAEHR